MGAPVDGTVRLKEHQQSLTERIDELTEVLDLDCEREEHGEGSGKGSGYEQVRMENGELVISPLEVENLPASTQLLEALVAARLRRLELADLVVEVDGWTYFTDHFTHAVGTEPRTQRVQEHLYAVLLAQTLWTPTLADLFTCCNRTKQDAQGLVILGHRPYPPAP